MKNPLFLASLLVLMAHLPAHVYLPGGCLGPFLRGQATLTPQPDKRLHRPLDLKGDAAGREETTASSKKVFEKLSFHHRYPSTLTRQPSDVAVLGQQVEGKNSRIAILDSVVQRLLLTKISFSTEFGEWPLPLQTCLRLPRSQCRQCESVDLN